MPCTAHSEHRREQKREALNVTNPGRLPLRHKQQGAAMPDDISAGPLRLASNSADPEAALLLSKAGVSDNGRGAWAVWLSPEATVVELSALMGGLAQNGRKCMAEHMGAGAFVLIPIDEGTTPPDAALLVACLSESIPSRLVNLRAHP